MRVVFDQKLSTSILDYQWPLLVENQSGGYRRFQHKARLGEDVNNRDL